MSPAQLRRAHLFGSNAPRSQLVRAVELTMLRDFESSIRPAVVITAAHR
jgi:hypothetical protein